MAARWCVVTYTGGPGGAAADTATEFPGDGARETGTEFMGTDLTDTVFKTAGGSAVTVNGA